jgi:hypothetical protein
MTTMPVITIRQPWPWAMFNLGKDVENRSWATKHRGPILVHASKWSRREEMNADLAKAFITAPLDAVKALKVPHGFGVDNFKAQCGGIVGVVTIVDCVQNHPSPWTIPGQWHWVLADARPLPFFACKGRLGIWRVETPEGMAV